MKKGKITLEVDNECMEFDVLNIMKSTPIEVASRIDSIHIINECIEEVIHECLRNDSMEPYMMEKTRANFEGNSISTFSRDIKT